MRRVTEALLRELAVHEAPVCLSLWLEVAAGGGEAEQVRITLRTAKEAGAGAVAAAGADGEAAEAVLRRLDALGYGDVAGGHDRRVAVFIAPDLTEVVDARFGETGVEAGPWFRLSPLLGDLALTPEHAVLAASDAEACLYRASGDELAREAVEGMPGALAEVSRFTDQQEKGNIHGREDSGAPAAVRGGDGGRPSGPEGVPHHSMGGHDWRDDKEADRREYARRLAGAAGRHLAGTGLPLVLAAEARLQGMIRESAGYPHLAPEGVTLHPREMDEARLGEEAAGCLSRTAERRRAEAWERIAASLGRGDGLAGDDAAGIATAAAAGRIAHLFVAPGARVPGRFDPESLAASAGPEGPVDLADLAIAETLRHGGEVFPLAGGEGATPMAAAYRYPA